MMLGDLVKLVLHARDDELVGKITFWAQGSLWFSDFNKSEIDLRF